MEDTKWSFPIEILKEDSLSLVLRKECGERIFVRTEIRGYEEGSRFIVVFRQSSRSPIRYLSKPKSACITNILRVLYSVIGPACIYILCSAHSSMKWLVVVVACTHIFVLFFWTRKENLGGLPEIIL